MIKTVTMIKTTVAALSIATLVAFAATPAEAGLSRGLTYHIIKYVVGGSVTAYGIYEGSNLIEKCFAPNEVECLLKMKYGKYLIHLGIQNRPSALDILNINLSHWRTNPYRNHGMLYVDQFSVQSL